MRGQFERSWEKERRGKIARRRRENRSGFGQSDDVRESKKKTPWRGDWKKLRQRPWRFGERERERERLVGLFIDQRRWIGFRANHPNPLEGYDLNPVRLDRDMIEQ